MHNKHTVKSKVPAEFRKGVVTDRNDTHECMLVCMAKICSKISLQQASQRFSFDLISGNYL
jgi:hypothetical protein